MRVTDVFLAVPTVISGLALASVLGTGVIGIVDRRDGALLGVDGAGSSSARRSRCGGARSSRPRSRWGRPGRTVIRRHILPEPREPDRDHRGVQRRDGRRGRRRASATSAPASSRRRRSGGTCSPRARGRSTTRRTSCIVPLACVVLIVFGVRPDRRVALAPRRRLAPEVMARYLIVRARPRPRHDRGRRPADVRAPVLAPGRPRAPDRRPARVAGGARDRPREPAPRRLGPVAARHVRDERRAGRPRRLVHPPPAGDRPRSWSACRRRPCSPSAG